MGGSIAISFNLTVLPLPKYYSSHVYLEMF